ncbi:hypothetical protein K1719_005750 [Acacia pycnantha]|nr:hypothetical protein K1719_005750 [Acacia pycnantha]
MIRIGMRGQMELLERKSNRLEGVEVRRVEQKRNHRSDEWFHGERHNADGRWRRDAGETAEVIGRASEVSKKVNKDGANGRMVSTEAVKEESLESMAGQDFDKSDKKHMGNGSMQMIIGLKLENSLKNNFVGSKNNGQVKGSINSQKVEVDSLSRAVAIAKKDNFESGNNEMVNIRKSSGFSDDSKSKMAKTKSSKDNNIGGSSAHSLKRDELKCMVDGTGAVDGSIYDNFTDESAYTVKIKARQSSDKKKKLISGPGIKGALNSCPVAGNKSALEMVQMEAAPQLIEEDWVCCDRCQKWRLLPVGIKPDQLPEKWLCSDRKQGKLKRKMEADIYQPRTLKKPKNEDIYITDAQLSPGMDLEKVAQNSRNGFPAKTSGKDMRKYDEYCLSEDVEDKLVGPLKKHGDQTQVSSNGGSLDLKSYSRKGSSLKKRKLEDWQDADKLHMSFQDYKQYDKGSASGSKKENKFRVLNPEAKSFTESKYKINRRGEMNQVFLSGSKNHAAVGAEVEGVGKGGPQRKHIEKVASHKVSDHVDPLGRDSGSGLLSLAATSSSSKVSGSHKCRINYADMKGSPVESVTSSPLRIPNDREGKLSLKVKEERVSYDLHSESLKIASIGSRVGDAKDQTGIQAKTSEVRDNNLLNFDVATVQQHEEDKRSGSELDRNKTKVSTSENGYFKDGGGQESVVEPNYDAFSQGSKNNAKCNFAQSKCEGKKNSVRHWPSEIGKQTELRQKDFEKSNPRVDASFSTSEEIFSQENIIQDLLEDGNKADTFCKESQDGKSKVLLSSVGEEKRETLSGSRTACDSGTSGPDQQLPARIPARTNYSQTAYDTLKEATSLKDRADHFKHSGFEFESNETFFEAALKFLHGASLLENFHKESSKGNISQMQDYTTTAKLYFI